MNKFKKTPQDIKIAYRLAKINFQLRVEGSYLGIFWYLLNPLILFLIIILIKNNAVFNQEIAYYPLYLFIGISTFNFFKKTINESIKVVPQNASLIKSSSDISISCLVYSTVFQYLFSHLFEIVILILIALFLNVSLVGFIYYPLILFFLFLMLIGISLIFSVIGTYINDLENVWQILSQVLFLATPIFYTINPNTLLYKLNLLNPFFYFLETARSILIYQKIINLDLFIFLIASSLILLFLGFFVFKKYSKYLAEKI
jgi:ABC-type polysaccharide/polyol phosphate export permease